MILNSDEIKERAVGLFIDGYNCAEATLAAFSEVLNIDRDILLKMSAPFGGGVARTRGQCGAVSAMLMAVGALRAVVLGDMQKNNGEIYAVSRELLDKFKELNGSLACSELLKNLDRLTVGGAPDARTAEYYAKRPCARFVENAIVILVEYINNSK